MSNFFTWLWEQLVDSVKPPSNDPARIKARRDALTGGATTVVAAAVSPSTLLTEGVPNAFTPEEWKKLNAAISSWQDEHAKLSSFQRQVAPHQNLGGVDITR